MSRVFAYVRVSITSQTTENQLREIAAELRLQRHFSYSDRIRYY